MTSVGEPFVTETRTDQTKTDQLKDRITAPEAAPARRGGGAAAATAVVGVGVWAWRRFRAQRRKTAARRHMKVIGHESKAVARLGAAALGEKMGQWGQVAKHQAGQGAKAAKRQAAVQVKTAQAKAAKARR